MSICRLGFEMEDDEGQTGYPIMCSFTHPG
jgi:hypothetical protein